MKFHEWLTAFSAARQVDRKIDDWRHFYARAVTLAEMENRQIALNQFKAEINWLKADKPYYCVWPKIIPMLVRLNLKKIDSSWMKLPLPELCIRLPAEQNPLGFEWNGKPYFIRCILMSAVEVSRHEGITLWIDPGEYELGMPIYTFQSFRCIPGRPLQQEIEELPIREGATEGVQIPRQTILQVVQLCCTLCFLGNNPQLITPDVLAEDLNKFETTGDRKYIEKAKKRHKIGWNIGRYVEISPHWRRPHFALYWVGKGRTQKVILPRKGALIHKDLISKVPTGREGPMDYAPRSKRESAD